MKSRVRNFFYLLTRLSQVMIPRKNNYDPNKNNFILFYPCFQSEIELADQINRIRWYLPKQTQYKIIIPVARNLKKFNLGLSSQPPYHRIIDGCSNLDHVVLIDEETIKEYINQAKVICLWKIRKTKDFAKFLIIFTKIRIVDPDYYLFTETHTYPAIYYYDLLPRKIREEWENESKSRFVEIFNSMRGTKNAYVFGTGPSVHEVEDCPISYGARIICNSMVKNERLLELICPNFLVFTDSVFHFGVSKYSGDFTKDVIKVVKKYGTICITNQVGYAMLRLNYPELAPFLIGVPAKRIGHANTLTPAKFMTRDYPNVLTRYMLPLAGGLSNEVVLFGFDGRNPQETYFWKHNSTTQYVENMDSTKLTHPAFFRDIDYDRYYEKHCSSLNDMLNIFEKEGIKVHTWTKSYIPCLQKRYFDSLNQKG